MSIDHVMRDGGSASTQSSGASRIIPSMLDRRLLFGLGGAKLLVHVLLAGRYGYFRDELYFLDCGRHLDWGYVDHAPLIGLVARLALMLGGSLHALRIFSACAGALLVALTLLMAWRLGAGRFGQDWPGWRSSPRPSTWGRTASCR